MATDVTRTLNIDYDNCDAYLTANGVSLSINLFGTKLAIRHYMNGAKTGYAQLNSDAMDALFPSATARPHTLDFGAYFGELTSNKNNWVELRIDGAAVKRWLGSAGETAETFTGATIEGMTKSSAIQSYHNANSTVTGTSTRYLNYTLHFWQYACSANAVGNGMESAAVSDAAPYQGDTVTFTATLKPGATWHGWYSDAACTQLVSTDQTYACPAADLTLYAKATIDTPSTGIYAKANGVHSEAQAAYKKINGVWVEQTDTAAFKNEMKIGRYIYKMEG